MIHAIFQYMMSKGVRWKLMNFFYEIKLKIKIGKKVTFKKRKKIQFYFNPYQDFLL